jgi:hypothetical protein
MDLEIQDKHEIQFMTYWFDEARCKAFCLVGAPNKAAIQNAHNEAHGMVPHEIIEVDPMIVEAFLGRVKDPAPVDKSGEAPIDGAYRVIMFTDLQDSTLMTTMFGDAKALHLLHIHNALTRNALRDHRGNEVKHTGDGIGLLLCLYRTESSVLLQSKKRSISITESTLNRHCICGLALALVNPLRSMVTFLEMQSNWRPAFVTMQSHARFLLHRWYRISARTWRYHSAAWAR